MSVLTVTAGLVDPWWPQIKSKDETHPHTSEHFPVLDIGINLISQSKQGKPLM
jgi:hypothetical protein